MKFIEKVVLNLNDNTITKHFYRDRMIEWLSYRLAGDLATLIVIGKKAVTIECVSNITSKAFADLENMIKKEISCDERLVEIINKDK